MNKKIMNVPNILSLIRVALVPAFVATLLAMRDIEIWGIIVPTLIYALTALTDMLDGKIARKYGLVTDFGKFIDPLADKFMVLGSNIAILAYLFMKGETLMATLFVWLVLIVLFRELGVTSLRLVVAGKKMKKDLSANIFGKLKTVSQMVGTVIILLEPLIFPFCRENHIIAYAVMAIIAFTTLASGLSYFRDYLPYMTADATDGSDADAVAEDTADTAGTDTAE